MYAKTRPSTRPSIFAPHHTPLHYRPPHSLKNVGFFQNSVESLMFMSHQKLLAPPRAPPCFMVVKFKIRAQTFHIIIFHENAFLVMYRPNRLFGIRSFTMLYKLQLLHSHTDSYYIILRHEHNLFRYNHQSKHQSLIIIKRPSNLRGGGTLFLSGNGFTANNWKC